jgi:hypothetical protein
MELEDAHTVIGAGRLTVRLRKQRLQPAGLEEGPEPWLAAIVTTERVAPIEAAVAHSVLTAWEAMLATVDTERKPRLGLDGEAYEFGRRTSNGEARGRTWSPPRGSRAGALVSLVEDLAEYATAASDRTSAVLSRIARAAEKVIGKAGATE